MIATILYLREDGTPYIEVHHIIPLCHGGEDGIWNLSVLCAHHHRMAHFADVKTRITVENFLLNEIAARI
ncbi:MAG: HNH endonuclease [Methylococcales bacterium]|nr:HNH endonuclease [Methylococcales bacterium]